MCVTNEILDLLVRVYKAILIVFSITFYSLGLASLIDFVISNEVRIRNKKSRWHSKEIKLDKDTKRK